ncbi:MAG: hypothetical protein HY303_13115 [Candidatus Wallbacteria bacterium]|nr:hypothetical protein [Candidatus Wallbacteria bacterium]
MRRVLGFTFLEIVVALSILIASIPIVYPIAIQWVKLEKRSADLFLKSTVAGIVHDRIVDDAAWNPAILRSLRQDSWGSVAGGLGTLQGPDGQALAPSPYFGNLFDISGQGAAHASNAESIAVSTPAQRIADGAASLAAAMPALAKTYAGLAVHVHIDQESDVPGLPVGAGRLARKLTVEVYRRDLESKTGWESEPYRLETRFLVPVESLEPADAAEIQQRFLRDEDDLSAKLAKTQLDAAGGYPGYGARVRAILEQLAAVRLGAALESVARSRLESAVRLLDAVQTPQGIQQRLEISAMQAEAISLAYRRMRQPLRKLRDECYAPWERDVVAERERTDKLAVKARDLLQKSEDVSRLASKPSGALDAALQKFRALGKDPVTPLANEVAEALKQTQELNAEARLLEYVLADPIVRRDLEQIRSYPPRLADAYVACERDARRLFEGDKREPRPGDVQKDTEALSTPVTECRAALAAIKWAEIERARELLSREETPPKDAQDAAAHVWERNRDTFRALASYFDPTGGQSPALEHGSELRQANAAFRDLFLELAKLDRGEELDANPAAAICRAVDDGGKVTSTLDAVGSVASILYKAAATWTLASVSQVPGIVEKTNAVPAEVPALPADAAQQRILLAAVVRQLAEATMRVSGLALEQMLTNRASLALGKESCRRMRLELAREAMSGGHAAAGPDAQSLLCSEGATVATSLSLTEALRLLATLGKSGGADGAASGSGWRALLKLKAGAHFPEPPPPAKFDLPPLTDGK